MACRRNASSARAKEIDRRLKKDFNNFKKELKVLLLGTGESGKSTIIKQITMIHGKGFDDQERRRLKVPIYQNLLRNMKAILDAMDTFQIPLQHPALADEAYTLQDTDIRNISDLEEFATSLFALWRDAGVQQAFARRNEYQLSDSTQYFFSEFSRISSPEYLPNDQDILRTRDPTTGIHEFTFVLDQAIFRMLDVGGQRSERKKWIHCFADLSSILFIVGASEYDQTLVEEQGVNRMHESTALFEQIVNYPHFREASMILFLNKQDILAEKIKSSPLEKYFPDFALKCNQDGRSLYDAAKEYILNLFLSRVPATRKIYHHYTTAIDRKNVEVVFTAAKDAILKVNLKDYGLY